MTSTPYVATTPDLALVVGPDAPAEVLRACGTALGGLADLEDVLDALRSTGRASTPDFAIAAREGTSVRLLLRGEVSVTAGDAEYRPAAGLATWREELVPARGAIRFQVGGVEVVQWFAGPDRGVAREAAGPVVAAATDGGDGGDLTPVADPVDDRTLADLTDAAGSADVTRREGWDPQRPLGDVPAPQQGGAAPMVGAWPPPTGPPSGGPPPAMPPRPGGSVPPPVEPAAAEPRTRDAAPSSASTAMPAEAAGRGDPGPAVGSEAADPTGASGPGAPASEPPGASGPADDGGPRRTRQLIVGVPSAGDAPDDPPQPAAGAVDAAGPEAVTPEGDDGDTILRPPGGFGSLGGAGGADAQDRDGVPSVVCPAGHANPPQSETCRSCQQRITDPAVRLVPRPVVARLRFDDGSILELDRPHIVGRRPSVPPDSELGQLVGLHTVPDVEKELSRNHLELHLDGWSVAVMDLGSVNGTWVTNPGKAPVRIRANVEQAVVLGATVRLADVTSFVLEPPV